MDGHESGNSPQSGVDPTDKNNIAKDRACPYCQQAFTSSSLGRHLDLYIKPKNPKRADGIHDVEEIRRIRENITRRQPRNSGLKRERSAEGSASARRGSHDLLDDDARIASPPMGYPPPPAAQMTAPRSYIQAESPQQARIQVERLTNPAPTVSVEDSYARPLNLPRPDFAQAQYEERSRRQEEPRPVESLIRESRQFALPPVRTSRQEPADMRPISGYRLNRPHWAATGVINDLPSQAGISRPQRRDDYVSIRDQSGAGSSIDEDETGNAALLALKEVLGSVRDASIRKNVAAALSLDILNYDFPSLCLRLLPAPTTLFTSHPWPTHESWPIEPPGRTQAEALQQIVEAQMQKFSHQAMDHPMAQASFTGPRDAQGGDLVRLRDHIWQAFTAWSRLSDEQRKSAWQLETLRAFARTNAEKRDSQSTIEAMRKQIETLNAEIARTKAAWRGYPNLDTRSSVHDLSGLTGMRLDETTYKQLSDQGLDPRNWDMDRLIGKWKSVIREERRSSSTTSNLPSRELPLPSASTLSGVQSSLKAKAASQVMAQQRGLTTAVGHASSNSTSNSDPSRAASSTTSPYSTATANHRAARRTISFDSPATNGSVNGQPMERDDDEDQANDNQELPDAPHRPRAAETSSSQASKPALRQSEAHARVPSGHIPRYWTPTEITGRWPPQRNREKDAQIKHQMDQDAERSRRERREQAIEEKKREDERKRKKREAEVLEEEERRRQLRFAQRMREQEAEEEEADDDESDDDDDESDEREEDASRAKAGASRSVDRAESSRSQVTSTGAQRPKTAGTNPSPATTAPPRRLEAGEFWQEEIRMAATGRIQD